MCVYVCVLGIDVYNELIQTIWVNASFSQPSLRLRARARCQGFLIFDFAFTSCLGNLSKIVLTIGSYCNQGRGVVVESADGPTSICNAHLCVTPLWLEIFRQDSAHKRETIIFNNERYEWEFFGMLVTYKCFLFCTFSSFLASSSSFARLILAPELFTAKIWIVPLSEEQASQFELQSNEIE